MTQHDSLLSRLKAVSLVRESEILPSGHIRLETPFKYPDGTSIELFIRPRDLLPEIQLSDLAQTTEWLLSMQIKPWLSKKRSALLDDALRTHGVDREGGELVVRVPDAEHLTDGVIRLSQACIRMADLYFTRRTALQSTFSEEVEEILIDWDLPYESEANAEGRYGKVVPVDFRVRGARVESLVLTLASHNPTAAHARATEVFSRWYDLAIPERTEQRVTVFDDRSGAYRDDDLKRLEDYSIVLPISEKPALQKLLAA